MSLFSALALLNLITFMPIKTSGYDMNLSVKDLNEEQSERYKE